jgi:hypothetical protein
MADGEMPSLAKRLSLRIHRFTVPSASPIALPRLGTSKCLRVDGVAVPQTVFGPLENNYGGLGGSWLGRGVAARVKGNCKHYIDDHKSNPIQSVPPREVSGGLPFRVVDASHWDSQKMLI